VKESVSPSKDELLLLVSKFPIFYDDVVVKADLLERLLDDEGGPCFASSLSIGS
jgi:hypothetical protein